MHARRSAIAALFVFSLALVTLGSVPTAAPAASTGLAWDSVTRLMTNADPASLQPGSFDADYAAAASAPPPSGGGGGMFAKYKQAIAAAQNFAQLMKTGLAEHHYVAGAKERTDQVAAQTATIVDCSARTITTLDLKAKTYRIEPIESPSSTGSGGAGDDSGPGGKNDVHLAITIANTALGSQQVGGLPANGYRSKMTFTETTSSGSSQTQNADVLGYYSSYSDPTTWCGRPNPGNQNTGQGMDVMAGYARLMRALATTGDPHFSIKQSGPPLPIGKLAMYSAMMFAMQGHSATFLTERGNVRAIGPDDAAFSVPTGFTQQK